MVRHPGLGRDDARTAWFWRFVLPRRMELGGAVDVKNASFFLSTITKSKVSGGPFTMVQLAFPVPFGFTS